MNRTRPLRQQHPSARLDRADESFARGLARAYGGAVLFSLPLMMTMEMWWLGFYMSPLRLALLIVVMIPVLVALSHIAGFEETFEWRDDLLDSLVAYAVGFSAGAVMLFLFSVVDGGMSWREIIGKISLQAVPGSIGAMLAQSQLGGRKAADTTARRRTERYTQEVFLMGIGALFFAFNVAPTEEMVLISYKMTAWDAVLLALLSLVIMHAFVYAVQFSGQHGRRPGARLSPLLSYTVVGYALALLISLYALWTFERTENVSAGHTVMMMLVLGFPAAIGAAAARLIL